MAIPTILDTDPAKLDDLLNVIGGAANTDIAALDTRIDAIEAGAGRGTRAIYSVASLAAVDAISTASIGDFAVFTAAPSTGIAGAAAALTMRAYSGTGSSLRWHFSAPLLPTTLANMDTLIAACVAITDLSTAFIVGQTFQVFNTGVVYKFTSTAGAYVPVTLTAVCDLSFSYSQASVGALVAVGSGGGAPYVEELDPLAWHDPSTNPSRITPTTAGKFDLIGTLQVATNGTGQRIIQLEKNGVAVAQHRAESASASGPSTFTIAWPVAANGSTDYFTMSMLQNSGSSLTISGRFTLRYTGA